MLNWDFWGWKLWRVIRILIMFSNLPFLFQVPQTTIPLITYDLESMLVNFHKSRFDFPSVQQLGSIIYISVIKHK